MMQIIVMIVVLAACWLGMIWLVNRYSALRDWPAQSDSKPRPNVQRARSDQAKPFVRRVL